MKKSRMVYRIKATFRYTGMLSFLLLVVSNKAFSQNVGIGTAVPIFKLDIREGSINTDSVYRINGQVMLAVKGIKSTFIGSNAGNAVTNPDHITAIGFRALYLNTTGIYNTAIGAEVLHDNTEGHNNTATGIYAMHNNTLGTWNTATGSHALSNNTTGDNNTSYGGHSMLFNTSGEMNVAIGSNALQNNTTGDYNTAIGESAMENTTGTSSHYNTAVGAHALRATFNSQYNTCLGFQAGNDFSLGHNNTIIGAQADGNAAGLTNILAVGRGTICPASNSARLGNTGTTSIGGWANWSNVSDGRFKNNVSEDVAGLTFILKLRPVNYQLKAVALQQYISRTNKSELDASLLNALYEKETMTMTGFIAQEVEAAAKETQFTFSGVDKPLQPDGVYGLRYAEFVVPLVKAVQELSQQNEDLRKKIEMLEKMLTAKKDH